MREELGFDGTEDIDYEDVFSRRPRYGCYVPHAPVDLFCSDPSLTDQSQVADADINTIMLKYEKMGTVPTPSGTPFYGDFSDVPSYQDALQVMRNAEEAFMALPARVRAEFDNDPGKFADFAENPENVQQMRDWGLAKPLDEPANPPAPEAKPTGEGGLRAAEPPTQ